MKDAKFIVAGEDKKVLAGIKNTLTANGYIFVGYSKETYNLLRYIRNCKPDLVIIEVRNRFDELKPLLEVIDEEILTSCILILEIRSDEILEFLKRARVITYLTKPVFDEVVLQIVDISLMSYDRVIEYEQKVQKLNDTLESRKVVEKAKWLLVKNDGYSESEAYGVIRKKSRDNRMTMRNIAEAIILTRGEIS